MARVLNANLDTNLGGENASNEVISSQKAVKTYVDDRSLGVVSDTNGDVILGSTLGGISGSSVIVDPTLNPSSTNPVQNSAIANALNSKADTSLSNLTDTGKINVASLCVPSGTFDELELGESGTEYQMPATGWLVISKRGNIGQWLTVINTTISFRVVASIQYSGTEACIYMPVSKNDVIRITYNLGGVTEVFQFNYAVGCESEKVQS